MSPAENSRRSLAWDSDVTINPFYLVLKWLFAFGTFSPQFATVSPLSWLSVSLFLRLPRLLHGRHCDMTGNEIKHLFNILQEVCLQRFIDVIRRIRRRENWGSFHTKRLVENAKHYASDEMKAWILTCGKRVIKVDNNNSTYPQAHQRWYQLVWLCSLQHNN